jgi:membrane protein
MRPRHLPPELWQTVSLLGRRFGHDRLGQTAAALSFTSLISMVPLLAVGLSLFTAFPAFHTMQARLQLHFAHLLLPPDIAATVLGYLNQFAAKAKGLGALGLAGLALLATSMMLTVDRALNAIWRTARPRSLAQRILVYWAALTLGPLLFGGALAASAALIVAHRGWLHELHAGVGLLLTLVSWLSMASALGALYRWVPNADVKWRDALAGSLFAAIGLDLAGRAIAWYVTSVPTYTAVYGTFATLPIFLLWIYWSWMLVLLGAVLASILPLLRMRALPQPRVAGARLLLALRVLRQLAQARQAPDCGVEPLQLAQALRCDPLDLQPCLDVLLELGWVGHLAPRPGRRTARWALLIDPAQTPAAALLDKLWLDPAAARTSPELARRAAAAGTECTLQQLWPQQD